jgi:hypothetical protein
LSFHCPAGRDALTGNSALDHPRARSSNARAEGGRPANRGFAEPTVRVPKGAGRVIFSRPFRKTGFPANVATTRAVDLIWPMELAPSGCRPALEVVEPKAAYVDSIKAWRFMLRDSVWDIEGVVDVTDKLKAAGLLT